MPYSTTTSTILIASISLLVTALTSFFLIQHYSEVLQAFFPAGEKIWYGPPGKRREQITKHGSTDYFVISLVYDLMTEQNLVINAAICFVAGALSLAAIWVKRGKSSFWKIAPTATAIIALIASIVSIIHVNVRRSVFHRSWCSERNGKGVRSAFRVTCTRELAACDLLVTGYLTDHDYANNKRLCTEARVSRALLIPFLVFSTLLVSVYAHRWWRLRSGYTAVAESEDFSEHGSEEPEEVEKTSTESS